MHSAADVSITARLPRLQRLGAYDTTRVRLVGASLQAPALSWLALSHPLFSGDANAVVDLGATPALRELCLHLIAFTAHGTPNLPQLTKLSLTDDMLSQAGEVLQGAAPSLHHLELHSFTWSQDAIEGEAAAAVRSMRQLTALKCVSRAVLPLLPVEGQLQELHVMCGLKQLQSEDIVHLGRLPRLRRVTFWRGAGL